MSRLVCLNEICLMVEWDRRMHAKYQAQEPDDADGYVYLAGTVTPDQEVHVKVGETACPRDRIASFNCASPSLYAGSFFKVRDRKFWEGTILNILQPYRIKRHYGLSEIINGRDVLNSVSELVEKWQPDPDALAWLYHAYLFIAERAGFPRMHELLVAEINEQKLASNALIARCLELFHRRLVLTTSSQVQSSSNDSQTYEGFSVYDRGANP